MTTRLENFQSSNIHAELTRHTLMMRLKKQQSRFSNVDMLTIAPLLSLDVLKANVEFYEAA